MSPSIVVKNLSKVYQKNSTEMLVAFSLAQAMKKFQVKSSTKNGTKIAVDDVSFELKSGDRIGIVGRNGAGKSTLISILAGLTQATLGSVEVDGHVTAVMTLGVGLKEDLSGRENIYIDGEIQGKSRNAVDQVIEEIIAFADIGEFIDYPLRTYSTGMKARLAFAMLVTLNPEILIIDEALSVGDANFAKKATQKIKEICDKGKIVIIVSHGMQSIIEMCNRCLWMENGNIVMDGNPKEVTSAYLEKVRKEDEGILVGKFRSHVGDFSYQEGCAVKRLTPMHNQLEKTIFQTGECFVLSIEVETASIELFDLKLQIIRLDGFVVSESLLSEQVASNCERYDLVLDSLVLSAGIYKIIVQLIAQHKVVAERSSIVEVQTLNLPAGGRPALIYPTTVSVVAKSNYQAEQKCLDLTATIQN